MFNTPAGTADTWMLLLLHLLLPLLLLLMPLLLQPLLLVCVQRL